MTAIITAAALVAAVAALGIAGSIGHLADAVREIAVMQREDRDARDQLATHLLHAARAPDPPS